MEEEHAVWVGAQGAEEGGGGGGGGGVGGGTRGSKQECNQGFTELLDLLMGALVQPGGRAG